LDLPYLEEGEDLVEAFLFKYEGGYPDHFSTVLTVMLRSINIPSRLVAGFGTGEFNPFTGYYIVRNTNAFAMTEVYFPKYGWFSFSAIPGTETIPPSIEESRVFSTLEQFWQWIAGWLPSPVTGFFNGIFTWVGGLIAGAIAFLSSLLSRGWTGLLIGLGILTGLSFLGWLLWNGWRAWRYRRWLAKLPPMESLYQKLLDWLAEHGFRKSPSQTPLEYFHQIRDRHSPAQLEVIAEISRAYVQWRYGGQTQNVTYLKQQLQRLQKIGSRD
jgi:protein-glutamine gamma-glutamyltransferase